MDVYKNLLLAMNIPNPTEKQENLGRFWWTVAPFYRSYKPDEDGGEHDIPAIIAEAVERERDEVYLAEHGKPRR